MQYSQNILRVRLARGILYVCERAIFLHLRAVLESLRSSFQMEEERLVYQEKMTADDTLICLLFVSVSVLSGNFLSTHLRCLPVSLLLKIVQCITTDKIPCRDVSKCIDSI